MARSYNYHIGVFSGTPWSGMQKFELWRVDTTSPKLERETLLTWDLDAVSCEHHLSTHAWASRPVVGHNAEEHLVE